MKHAARFGNGAYLAEDLEKAGIEQGVFLLHNPGCKCTACPWYPAELLYVCGCSCHGIRDNICSYDVYAMLFVGALASHSPTPSPPTMEPASPLVPVGVQLKLPP